MWEEFTEKARSTIRRDPVCWASSCGVNLRPYQREIALAVKESIIHHLGCSFVVLLPRQSGKNELQAHLFAWLLFRNKDTGGRIASVSPTFKPQTLNNMDRVRLSLDACIGSRGRWTRSGGYMYVLGQARLQFFSGETTSRVVGATADLLLSVDEAQEISILKFDKDFDPMTASTNATRIFWGTVWTSDTLLERQRRFALEAEQKDGLRRVFFYTAEDVCRLVPAYAAHLHRVISEQGRNNPLVRSQYFCELVDSQAGMFTPTRLALIEAPSLLAAPPSAAAEPPHLSTVGAVLAQHESHVLDGIPRSVAEGGEPPLHQQPAPKFGEPPVPLREPPLPSVTRKPPVAFLLDVAGQDEQAGCAGGAFAQPPLGTSAAMPSRRFISSGSSALSNSSRDSTALTVVEIDTSSLAALEHPTYHVVARHSWIGENHTSIFGKLKALAASWQPQYLVVDATGVGEGLWGMLDRHFPGRVIPVKFTQSEKSEIGWRFLSIVETGRFRDHCHTAEVHLQYVRCLYEILPGPAKTLRWGVPESARGPEGLLVHDDFVLADSLVSKLDALPWKPLLTIPPVLIYPTVDPLKELSLHY